MSDPLERDGDRMFAAAAEYGRRVLGWKDGDEDDDPSEDHRTIAGNFLDLSGGTAVNEGAGSPASAAYAARAQAHATLYLAEQQRVANMIAFGQATGESYRAEIRKALGISHE